MRTYKTQKGYFYKELQNGKKKRISKEEHQKLKQQTTLVKKKIKQRGGKFTTLQLATMLKNKEIIDDNTYELVTEYRKDELWDSKCVDRKKLSLSIVNCKKTQCKKHVGRTDKLFQCSYCGNKYHNNCTIRCKQSLKSTEGAYEGVPYFGHRTGNTNKNTKVCGTCNLFIIEGRKYLSSNTNGPQSQ